jgi:hypothetical protein
VNGGGQRKANQREQILALQLQIDALKRTVDELKTTQEMDRVQGRREFQILNQKFRRFAMERNNQEAAAPNQAAEPNNQEAGAIAAEPTQAAYASATLCPNPRTLYNLWEEYKHGIGGRKAACLFTSQERGKVKHKYHRRKAVWDCISALVGAGVSSQVAIDRIYSVYGLGTPVTRIIIQLKRDRKAGNLHRSLQIS